MPKFAKSGKLLFSGDYVFRQEGQKVHFSMMFEQGPMDMTHLCPLVLATNFADIIKDY